MTNEQLRQHLINAGLFPTSTPRRRNPLTKILTQVLASVVFTLTSAFGVWIIGVAFDLGWAYWSDGILAGMGTMIVINSARAYHRAVNDE